MKFLVILIILLTAMPAVSDTVPVAQLQACLEQPIGPLELPEGITEDQLVETIRSEVDKVCMNSATQSCFLSDNSDRCFGALNLYAEQEYLRIFQTKAPPNLDLRNDETANDLIDILENYRTNELELGSGYSCNYSKPMCDFLSNSMLLVGLRSAVRISEHAN